ncbi:hypothetical protein D3C76_1336220 [compost metagenome]
MVASQIKEKFGTLRFYYRGEGDDFVEGLIDLAEELSGNICEICGSVGLTYERNNWLSTRCPPHAAKSSQTTATHLASIDSSSPLAEVLAAALGLFDCNGTSAARWLASPNWALSQSPLKEAIADNNYRRVWTLVGQIEYGVL